MDRQTLANYGWIVTVALILAVMLALATPFGKYVMDGVSSIASGYINTSNEAMSDANKDKLVAEWEDKWLNNNQDNGEANNNINNIEPDNSKEESLYNHNAPELHPTNIDLDGNGRTTPQSGDIYKYGDYKYTYDYSIDGWIVDLNKEVTDDNQTEYGRILESINGEYIRELDYTFIYCYNLVKPPVLPQNLTIMDKAFYGCSSLVQVPVIPSTVKDMNCAFTGCSSITTAPIIPNGVTDITYLFNSCTSLKTYVGSTDPDGDFSNYIIPDSVTTMNGVFVSNKNITTMPRIPNNVTVLQWLCYGMTSVTGEIEININTSLYAECFKYVDFQKQKITLTGTSSKLDTYGATGKNYCADHNGYCETYCGLCKSHLCQELCPHCNKTHTLCNHWCDSCNSYDCEDICPYCNSVCDSRCKHWCWGCQEYRSDNEDHTKYWCHECQERHNDGITYCDNCGYCTILHQCPYCDGTCFNCEHGCWDCYNYHENGYEMCENCYMCKGYCGCE